MSELENEFQYKLFKIHYMLESGDIKTYQEKCLCSSCKNQIHNITLSYEIIKMRLKRNQLKLKYKIPVFCCKCFEKIKKMVE